VAGVAAGRHGAGGLGVLLGHHYSPVVFDDPNFERREYDRWAAYGQSKTANILFALALDERGEADSVRAFSLHPGNIASTDLARYLSFEDLRGFGAIDEHGNPIFDPARGTKTVEQGAATSVWCTTSPRLDGMGGVYCEDCDVAPLGRADDAVDPSTEAIYDLGTQSRGVMPYAVDPAAADRLWDLSERLTGTAPR
jgi:hypothetical protein